MIGHIHISTFALHAIALPVFIYFGLLTGYLKFLGRVLRKFGYCTFDTIGMTCFYLVVVVPNSMVTDWKESLYRRIRESCRMKVAFIRYATDFVTDLYYEIFYFPVNKNEHPQNVQQGLDVANGAINHGAPIGGQPSGRAPAG